MKKQNEENIPDVERQEWEAAKIIKEGANEESDEVVRKLLRGNESDGNGDDRDIIPTSKVIGADE